MNQGFVSVAPHGNANPDRLFFFFNTHFVIANDEGGRLASHRFNPRFVTQVF